MLNRQQLKDYRILRELSTRDVAYYCDLSQPMIVQIENGTKSLTQHNHDEMVKGINAAYSAIRNGVFEKAPSVNAGKETKAKSTTKKTTKTTKKKTTKKG